MIDGATSASNPKALATNLKKGKNSFKWEVTNEAGCSNAVNIYVDYLEPDATLTHHDMQWCSSTYELSALNNPADNGYTGLWSVTEGSADIDDPTNYRTIVRGLKRGETTEITWTVLSKESCKGSDVIKITNKLLKLQPLMLRIVVLIINLVQ